MTQTNRMDRNVRKIAGAIFVLLLIWMVIRIMYGSEGFVDAGHCGVDLPSCSGERIRCMNGYCKSDVAPTLPLLSDLPMTPATKY